MTTPEFPLSSEQVNTIHDASISVLSNTGFRFACEGVTEIFRQHGFRIEDGKVIFTEKAVQTALETVPKEITIMARNRSRDIRLHLNSLSFGMGRGAVTIIDQDGTYRSATKNDVIDSLKLGQSLDVLEHVYPLVYPYDVDGSNVHLWLSQTAIKYSDKPCNYIDRHDIELMSIVYGLNPSKMAERGNLTESPGHATAIIDSPLTINKENCDNLMEYVHAGIAFHVASMPVACTTGPATAAGTIVLQNCENLAPIVLSQLVSPGCPAFYGALAGHADMMSLRPLFGTPEARLLERAGSQMAKHYGLICRGNAGLTDAPSYDFQAGAQAMISAMSVLKEGPNFLTGCGLLGSYRGGSLAKIVLDAELLELVRRYLNPIDTGPESLAVDVIGEIGPGGNFIEHIHTLENYRNYIYTEGLFPSPSYENWLASGRRDASQLAHEKARKLIDAYEKPPMDQGLEEAIDEYVLRKWVKH